MSFFGYVSDILIVWLNWISDLYYLVFFLIPIYDFWYWGFDDWGVWRYQVKQCPCVNEAHLTSFSTVRFCREGERTPMRWGEGHSGVFLRWGISLEKRYVGSSGIAHSPDGVWDFYMNFLLYELFIKWTFWSLFFDSLFLFICVIIEYYYTLVYCLGLLII